MGITWEEKGSSVFTFCVYIKGHYLSQFCTPLPQLIPTSTGVILLMARRCATLAFAHGIAKASISTSLITLTTHPIVGVPRMMGTLIAKFEKSGMIRAI